MKKDMPLEGLRWSRDSGSALYDTPQTAVLGRAGGERRKRKYAALGIENRILDSILIPIVNCLFDGERLLRKSL